MTYLDDEQLSYPGHPNKDQLAVLDAFVDAYEDARVIGWHYPTGGPMVVGSDGKWVSISPSGHVHCLVR